MYTIKDLRMFRLGLVAALLLAGLIVSVDTALAYEEWEKGNVPGSEFDEFQSEAVMDVILDTNGSGTVTDPPEFGDTEIKGITVRGPTKILRGPSPADDGNEPLDFHVPLRDLTPESDLLFDIRTEIVDMSLTGFSGMITIEAGTTYGLSPSIGAIEQQGNSTDWPADSWFDIYFRLTVGAPYNWSNLTNSVPAHMAAVIWEIPPIGIDYLLEDPIMLRNTFGEEKVLLTHSRHTPLAAAVPFFPNWYFGMGAVALAGALGYLIWQRRLAQQEA